MNWPDRLDVIELVHGQKSMIKSVSDACIEYNPVKCFPCQVLLGENDGQTGM